MNEIKVFAPATVANVGPGFDVFGFALGQPGDIITARKIDSGVRLTKISNPRLPKEANKNCVSIAAAEVVKMANRRGIRGGVELEVEKGISLGSGMGGSSQRLPRRQCFSLPFWRIYFNQDIRAIGDNTIEIAERSNMHSSQPGV